MNPELVPHAAATLSPVALFLQADIVVKGVMIGLLLASVWTWGIIIAHAIRLRGIGGANERFERDFRKGTNGSKMNADRARQFGEPLGIRWQWLMWQEGAPWAEAEPYTQVKQLKEVAEIADEGEAAALLAAWAAIKSRAGTGG